MRKVHIQLKELVEPNTACRLHDNFNAIVIFLEYIGQFEGQN